LRDYKEVQKMASSVVERKKSIGLIQPSLEFYAGLQKRPSDIPAVSSRKPAKMAPGFSAASKAPSVPFRERPTCSIAEACAAAGFGRTKLYELLDEGIVSAIKVGRRRLVRVNSLLALLEDGPAAL
jgi:excisionase family DNA binding protein